MEAIGVCVIVLDKEKKRVLLGKRLNAYGAGMLGAPGGRIEVTEALDECGRRELVEETALVANTMKYLGVVRELQTDHNFIHFTFICDEFTGEPKVTEPDKCESWDWYLFDNLPANILPGHIAAIDMYLKKDPLRVRDLH